MGRDFFYKSRCNFSAIRVINLYISKNIGFNISCVKTKKKSQNR
nr:MAG TPA: hypothetical protein [Caudoviricetes sp.]